ncbi:MAG: DNA primase [Candidatus Yanofskybacteria bacterium CG10_big_fil_rev_8_21_14_0_10_46_23]|uniref:DNA primase n=1 Tax=Candidatus Yanofskybacteria bacterium CG10_big_fil_rev_8_21_14_0_10_46_23 TaxID=1975098 RepID=A0A2H0R4X8_9BACT|nr:MAG: DNA primase [Candidatus Yanofskybacteria bacterium CG10_big_fil_rev_8_21_14_0_10_46_23]
MDDAIQQVRDRIDIVDLISEYIKLQKAGSNLKAPCPFHNEKTPSFFVSPERQTWHCFGCNLGGSIFDFVMEYEGVEFGPALRMLAHRAGVTLTEYDQKEKGEREQLLNIIEKSTQFYEKQLWESKPGQTAVKYLLNRGVAEKLLKSFRVGFAPEAWEGLTGFLEKTFTNQNLQRSGMSIARENKSGFYDRFRGRIMFPINNIHGQPIGFSGRIFSPTGQVNDQVGKYINSPQTLIYDKSRTLFALDRARQQIKERGRSLIMEGVMDVILAHQIGVDHAVASTGTALTEEQIGIVKRYAPTIDLSFDTDPAGVMATEKAVGASLAQGLNVNVVTLDDPDCKDPADYIQKHTRKFTERVENPVAVMDFFADQAFKSFDPATPQGKKAIGAKLLPFINRISNSIEQSHWLNNLAVRLQTPESVLRQELVSFSNLSPGLNSNSLEKTSQIVKVADLLTLEKAILALIIYRPMWYKDNYTKFDTSVLSDESQNLLKKLRQSELKENSIDVFVSPLADSIKKVINRWYLQAQVQWDDIEEPDFLAVLDQLFLSLRGKKIKAELTELEYKIKEAERTKNQARVLTLAQKFIELSRKI